MTPGTAAGAADGTADWTAAGTTLRAAVVALELRREPSVAAWLEHVDGLVRPAAEAGAGLVVLPELAGTGLLAAITSHEVTTASVVRDYQEVLPGFTAEVVDGLAALAARHGVDLLGGSHCRVDADGSLRNTAYLVRRDGRVQTQDKLHLTPQEHALGMRGGDGLLVTQVGPFTAGVLVCADLEFPELGRALVARGVDLVLAPSLTWNRRGVTRMTVAAQARAMENQLYVLLAPLVGSSGLPADAPLHAIGRALATGPIDRTVGVNDGVLAAADGPGESVLLVDLDPALLTRSRAAPEVPGLGLRRLDLYPEDPFTPDPD